jgi:hypothetical protein
VTAAGLAQAVAGHALTAGEPAAPVLRELGLHGAAARLEAGHLREGLEQAGFPRDVARLAEAWPAAVGPATDRLARVPSSGPPAAAGVQAAAWVVMVGFAHASILALMAVRLGDEVVPRRWLMTTVATADLLVVGVALATAAWLAGWLPGRPSPVGRHSNRAREACLLAALHDAAAPGEVRARFLEGLREVRADSPFVGDLDAVVAGAVADADAAGRRLAVAIRVGGIGVLAFLAALAVRDLYVGIASLGVAIQP